MAFGFAPRPAAAYFYPPRIASSPAPYRYTIKSTTVYPSGFHSARTSRRLDYETKSVAVSVGEAHRCGRSCFESLEKHHESFSSEYSLKSKVLRS